MQQLPTTLIKFFWHFAKKQRLAFIVFFLAPCLLIFEVTVIPYGLKMIIDVISQPQQNHAAIFQQLTPALGLIGISWLLIIALMRLQNNWQASVIPAFQADIRLSVLDYLTRHDYHYFANQFAGNLANKIGDLARSLDTIRMIVSWNIIGSLSTSLASLIVLIFISPIFAAILAIWIATHLIISVTKAGAVNQAAERNAEDKSNLIGAVVDVLTNIIPVKLFSSRLQELRFIREKQTIEAESNKQFIRKTNVFRLSMDIPMLAMMAVMVYFLISYWQLGKISTGDFVFIFNTTFAITNQMWFLGQALTDLFREVGTARQALALINVPHKIVDSPSATSLQVTRGEIVFHDVSFNFEGGVNVFKNKNVIIHAGQKVGLVGFSGAGKTSFVHLMLRFFDVTSGAIFIDKQNIAQVTQESLRANIAMIPQDTTLFHRSIIDNIRYGKIDASDEEVIAAAKLAHCHEFIISLPESYRTQVGERGIKLSGGQRQRIAIARAILKNAPILILDEATSSLDSVTEHHIQESIDILMKKCTTIVIAHRLSTLAKMERILVFSHGQIIEDGQHNDLLHADGHYAKLWKMQAGGFLPNSLF